MRFPTATGEIRVAATELFWLWLFRQPGHMGDEFELNNWETFKGFRQQVSSVNKIKTK